jgi:hypothetical protein
MMETEALHPHRLRSDSYPGIRLLVHLIANIADSFTYRDAVVRL